MAHFYSDPTRWKVDGRCYDLKKIQTQIIYANKMLSTNALSIFILHHHQNGICNKNLRSIQDIISASEPSAKKYKKVCNDLPNIDILTKSATSGGVQLMNAHTTAGNKYLG